VAKILGLHSTLVNADDFCKHKKVNTAVTSAKELRDDESATRPSHFFTDAETARRACFAYAARGNIKSKNGVAESQAEKWMARTAAAFVFSSTNQAISTSSSHKSTDTTLRRESAPIPPYTSTPSSPLSISSIIPAVFSLASAIDWVASK